MTVPVIVPLAHGLLSMYLDIFPAIYIPALILPAPGPSTFGAKFRKGPMAGISFPKLSANSGIV